jgi:hypothetical protein
MPPRLAEVFEEIIHQAFGFILGIQELEHVVGALVREIGSYGGASLLST